MSTQIAPEVFKRRYFTPKELADLLEVRSPEWVRAQCREGKIPTAWPHKPPYMILQSALFLFQLAEKSPAEGAAK